MRILKFLRALKRSWSKYRPSVEVFISVDNLLHNLREYQRQYPQLSFAPVLKSNAYGHGLTIVAQILDKANIAFFVVDSLFEAMILRNEGIKSKILVVGYTSTVNIKNNKISEVAFTITSLEHLQAIVCAIDRIKKFHLKIDTGMNRQGILSSQITEAIKIIQDSKNIELEGVCSHLADADNADESFTKSQVRQWQSIVKIFKDKFPDIKYYHLAASAGVFYADFPIGSAVRLGMGLYGLNVSPLARLDLRPVLRIQSIISSVKTISVGEFVGYGLTYKTDKTIKIATVPVGYFEGVDRRLSNKGFLKIGDYFCPIIGRVSMNITTIDVSAVPDVKLGDQVIVVSDGRTDINSVESMAKLAQTIPYEILIHIPQHLRRTVV
ncbi:MAG: Alanine racemase [Parcubacteria group bacterium GW2011_GWA2_43_9b]|nr:MAG: Alanine racemase [Parcubacteria group bacterium GW2011_GWA2_43_9b]